MNYDWDAAKAARNLKKHGVTFEEAGFVFGDPLACTFPDPDHSIGELRFLTFGMSISQRIFVVPHIEHAHGIHIINAREATAHKRKIWQDE
ncbi:MAG: BrnT family toxin [Metallibacterium sp.]